jgi:hypothetical protein
MPVTDFLEEKRREITDRLKELKPQVDEYNRLEAAVSALAKVGGSAPASAAGTTTAPRRRGPGRRRGSVNRASKATAASTSAATAPAATPAKAARKKLGRPPGRKKVGRPPGSATKGASSSTKRRVGRRKGSGTRALQALSFVQEQPGITIPELAAKMGIKENYLYRVLPALAQEGKLEKKGRGYHPKQA